MFKTLRIIASCYKLSAANTHTLSFILTPAASSCYQWSGTNKQKLPLNFFKPAFKLYQWRRASNQQFSEPFAQVQRFFKNYITVLVPRMLIEKAEYHFPDGF